MNMYLFTKNIEISINLYKLISICVNFNYLNINVRDGLVPPVHFMGCLT